MKPADRYLVKKTMSDEQFALYERVISVINSCTNNWQLFWALQYGILASNKVNYPFIWNGFVDEKLKSFKKEMGRGEPC